MAHPDNRFYGHDVVLGLFTGVRPRPIDGQLQHGWDPGYPYTNPRRLSPRLPKLVWARHNAEAVRAAGFRRVTRVGAPFLYLLEILGSDYEPQERSGTLAYPFHSTDREGVVGSHQELAAAFRDAAQSHLSVCLYWSDYADPRVRAVYEEAGVEVLCHGHRSDPAFLIRQLRTLQRFEHVLANRVCTALWYGAAVGSYVQVIGPTFVAPRFDPPLGEVERRERSDWPELFEGGIGGSEAASAAWRELGGDSLRDPAELADILGWNRARICDPVVSARGSVCHHARRAAYFAGAVHSSEVRNELATVLRWRRMRSLGA